MTFDDALQVLGIEPTVSRKAARRAYLSLIKVHKPDRDPLGFQRVRAAFELVDSQLEWRQVLPASLDDLGSELSARATEVPAVLSTPAAEPVDAPAETADAPVLQAYSSPAALMQGALRAINADAPGQAEGDALRAFQRARQALDATPPSAYDALHVCLLLYSKRHPRRARAVGQAFVQWLRDSGAERDLMGGWTVGRLAVLHALLALPAGLHSTPLSIIATGMLDDDFDIQTALNTFAQDKPFASLQVREALERYAPNLAEIWAAAMRRGEDSRNQRVLDGRPRRPSRPRPPEHVFDDSEQLMGKIARFGFVLLILFLLSTTCESKPPPMSATYRADLAKALESTPLRRQPASPATASAPSAPPIDWSKHPEWLRLFCETNAGSKCARAQSILSAIDAGKCAVAKRRYAWLSTDMMLDSKMRDALKVVGRTIKAKCTASP